MAQQQWFNSNALSDGCADISVILGTGKGVCDPTIRAAPIMDSQAKSERPGLRPTHPHWLDALPRVERERGAGLWMGAAFCAALCLAVVVLAAFGPGERWAPGTHNDYQHEGR